MKRMHVAALAALSVLILAVPVLGAPPPKPLPGDLDASWGTGGSVFTPFPDESFALDVLVKGDQTTAVGGSCCPGDAFFAIARYDRSGTLTRAVTTDVPGIASA